MNTRTPTLIAAASGLVLALGLAAPAADAQQRAARPAAQPRAVTRTVEHRRVENGRTRHGTATDAQGRTVTHDASVLRDREAGQRTRRATTTLPDGRTRSVDDVTQRTDSGYERSTTVVNPNGGQVQRDVTATRDADGQGWTREIAVERTPPATPPTP